MSLGVDVHHALPDLRRQALSLMVDSARFVRPGPAVFNPDTELLEPGADTLVHEGPCRLRAPSAVELRRLFGEEQVTTSRYIAALPHDVTGIEIGDVMTLTSSADPLALARTYRVVIVPAGTDLVLRAVGVEVVER